MVTARIVGRTPFSSALTASRRARELEALAEVLAHGIRRTTASDIARRCGIARQTLYRYWPDAQAVFAALVTRELVAALPAEAGDSADLGGKLSLIHI